MYEQQVYIHTHTTRVWLRVRSRVRVSVRIRVRVRERVRGTGKRRGKVSVRVWVRVKMRESGPVTMWVAVYRQINCLYIQPLSFPSIYPQKSKIDRVLGTVALYFYSGIMFFSFSSKRASMSEPGYTTVL
jgi:hypothetical protein